MPRHDGVVNLVIIRPEADALRTRETRPATHHSLITPPHPRIGIKRPEMTIR